MAFLVTFQLSLSAPTTTHILKRSFKKVIWLASSFLLFTLLSLMVFSLLSMLASETAHVWAVFAHARARPHTHPRTQMSRWHVRVCVCILSVNICEIMCGLPWRHIVFSPPESWCWNSLWHFNEEDDLLRVRVEHRQEGMKEMRKEKCKSSLLPIGPAVLFTFDVNRTAVWWFCHIKAPFIKK